MKILDEKVWEQILIRVTSNIIVSLLTSFISIIIVIVVLIYDPLKKIIEDKIPVSTLFILIIVLIISLVLSILYSIILKKKTNIKLIGAVGAYWDKELNAYCPFCKTMLCNYSVYQTFSGYEMGMKCISCDNIIHFGDDEKQFYSLKDAKELVKVKYM